MGNAAAAGLLALPTCGARPGGNKGGGCATSSTGSSPAARRAPVLLPFLSGQRRAAEAARSAASGSGVALADVILAATEIVQIAGLAAYHTSIVIGRREYYFDIRGICSDPALWSHTSGGGAGMPEEAAAALPEDGREGDCPSAPFRTEVRRIGATAWSGQALMQALSPFFTAGSYDVLHKNCNAFTDAALYFLCGWRLPGRYSRLERLLLAAEPLSTAVLNKFLRAATQDLDPEAVEKLRWPAGQAQPGDLAGGAPLDEPSGGVGPELQYIANPLAQGFSVDNVIAFWETAAGDAAVERATCSYSCGMGTAQAAAPPKLLGSACCAGAEWAGLCRLPPAAGSGPATRAHPRQEAASARLVEL